MPLLIRTGGASMTPLELRGSVDLGIAEKFFKHRQQLITWCGEHHIRFGCDLHMTADAHCFQPAVDEGLILHEGKTFHQYTDSWHAQPRYSVALSSLKSPVAEASRHYRLVFRDIARSNDERTMIACIAPPGVVFGHTATVEKTPWARANSDALVLCALFNSFSFDWLVRQKAATHLSLYILNGLPIPHLSDEARRFLAHGALQLSCIHAGYAALRREQGCNVVANNVVDIRACIDAVVAGAYGLDRDQYEHVLCSFSHRSQPDTMSRCLVAFDELQAQGLLSFCRRYDLNNHVALVTNRAELSG